MPGAVAEGATGVWGGIKGWTADRLARSSSGSLDDGDEADSDEEDDEQGLSEEERKGDHRLTRLACCLLLTLGCIMVSPM
jgi:hypothetical protein